MFVQSYPGGTVGSGFRAFVTGDAKIRGLVAFAADGGALLHAAGMIGDPLRGVENIFVAIGAILPFMADGAIFRLFHSRAKVAFDPLLEMGVGAAILMAGLAILRLVAR